MGQTAIITGAGQRWEAAAWLSASDGLILPSDNNEGDRDTSCAEFT